MRLATRSNLLAALAGVIAVALGAWGRYRSWWWYDNVAHLSAGISLGALVATEDSDLLQDLAIVAAISTLWELFEYLKRVHPWGGDGALEDAAAAEDTVLDTILVLIGAAFAASRPKED